MSTLSACSTLRPDCARAGAAPRRGWSSPSRRCQMTGPYLVGQAGFARAHPGAVAEQRVDLAVVGQQAEGLGELPGREGVGRIALVIDRQRRSRSRGRAGRDRRPAAGAPRTGPCRRACGTRATRRRSRARSSPSASARRSMALRARYSVVLEGRSRVGRAARSAPGECAAASMRAPSPSCSASIGTSRQPSSAQPLRFQRASTMSLALAGSAGQKEHPDAEQVLVVEAHAEALELRGEQLARDLGRARPSRHRSCHRRRPHRGGSGWRLPRPLSRRCRGRLPAQASDEADAARVMLEARVVQPARLEVRASRAVLPPATCSDWEIG